MRDFEVLTEILRGGIFQGILLKFAVAKETVGRIKMPNFTLLGSHLGIFAFNKTPVNVFTMFLPDFVKQNR